MSFYLKYRQNHDNWWLLGYMLMALLISHKKLTLIMEVSPLPWKVQWADHGMGSVTTNGCTLVDVLGMIVLNFTIPKLTNGKLNLVLDFLNSKEEYVRTSMISLDNLRNIKFVICTFLFTPVCIRLIGT